MVLTVVGAVLCVGCGGDAMSLVISEEEMGRITEELVELPLGEYEVPVPAAYTDEYNRTHYRTVLLFRFRLDAVITPRERSAAERVVERNSGALHDRVMTTCRKSTVDDLLDPQLTAFRARLMDSVQPLFEGHMLRRVVISDVIQDPM